MVLLVLVAVIVIFLLIAGLVYRRTEQTRHKPRHRSNGPWRI